jgi:hypothetical protein
MPGMLSNKRAFGQEGYRNLFTARPLRSFVIRGGLISYGNDAIADFRHAAFVAAATISPSLWQGCRVGLEAATQVTGNLLPLEHDTPT